MRRKTTVMAVGVAVLTGVGCDFDSELAPRVELNVVVDASGMNPATSDLGYTIEPTRWRVAIDTVEFTTDGETHARAAGGWLDTLHGLVVPTAYAHPGHYAGGEIVGELPGHYVFDWLDDGAVLGTATMLNALYSGANFTFARAVPQTGVPADDPIVGHTFDIAGVASAAGHSVTFEVMLDEDPGRRVVGIPFDLDVDEHSDEAIGLSLRLQDPFQPDTAFDRIDFFALDDDGDGHVVIESLSEPYNRLRNNLQAHDYYYAQVN